MDRHKEEIISSNTEHTETLAQLVKQKDSIIAETKNQVYDLKNQLSKANMKYDDLQKDYERMKFESDTQIDNLSKQIKNQIEIFDSTRNDYDSRINNVKDRYDYDRTALKQEYETLIKASRDEHNQIHEELSEVIRVKNNEIDMLRADQAEFRVSFTVRINQLEKENYDFQNCLKQSQKLSEMQMKENKKLIERKTFLGKELRILQKEITLLEQEHVKVVDQNKELRSRLEKLDKIVYGKTSKTGSKRS